MTSHHCLTSLCLMSHTPSLTCCNCLAGPPGTADVQDLSLLPSSSPPLPPTPPHLHFSSSSLFPKQQQQSPICWSAVSGPLLKDPVSAALFYQTLLQEFSSPCSSSTSCSSSSSGAPPSSSSSSSSASHLSQLLHSHLNFPAEEEMKKQETVKVMKRILEIRANNCFMCKDNTPPHHDIKQCTNFKKAIGNCCVLCKMAVSGFFSEHRKECVAGPPPPSGICLCPQCGLPEGTCPLHLEFPPPTLKRDVHHIVSLTALVLSNATGLSQKLTSLLQSGKHNLLYSESISVFIEQSQQAINFGTNWYVNLFSPEFTYFALVNWNWIQNIFLY